MEITGTPGEIYEQHMIPAIFARWAPELVDVLGVRPGEARARSGLRYGDCHPLSH